MNVWKYTYYESGGFYLEFYLGNLPKFYEYVTWIRLDNGSKLFVF